MTILSIETSCDETAIAILHGESDAPHDIAGTRLSLLGNALLSQTPLHAEYGGVFPSLAKREHARNLVPLLKKVLKDAGMIKESVTSPHPLLPTPYNLQSLLAREPELLAALVDFLPTISKPPIDALGVTYGPGLEPALWVGVNCTRALSLAWDIPVVPVDHMEGHIFSALLRRDDSDSSTHYSLLTAHYPALALLVSGGHTELVLMRDFLSYEILGETRDDAAGEAFDKVARLLGLPYPGGPALAALAASARPSPSSSRQTTHYSLPRPLLHSPDFDFSFSGLKTAVLYHLKKHPDPAPRERALLAREFEDAAVEVLVTKTLRAAETFSARTILAGGGVAANTHLREKLTSGAHEAGLPPPLFPDSDLTGDNAVMIGAAAYAHLARESLSSFSVNPDIRAEGNHRLMCNHIYCAVVSNQHMSLNRREIS